MLPVEYLALTSPLVWPFWPKSSLSQTISMNHLLIRGKKLSENHPKKDDLWLTFHMTFSLNHPSFCLTFKDDPCQQFVIGMVSAIVSKPHKRILQFIRHSNIYIIPISRLVFQHLSNKHQMNNCTRDRCFSLSLENQSMSFSP